jgi:hypothetical protein
VDAPGKAANCSLSFTYTMIRHNYA